MPRITVTREVIIPDILRLQRYQRVPELGPTVLFFSGGSALKDFSRELKNYTHNSIHLMTPFDSGGSSAILRQHFNMPAVGDIRNRLMALADQTVTGHPEVYELAGLRLDSESSQEELKQELQSMVDGEHALIRSIPNPMRRLIRLQLGFFAEHMPASFNLKGASVGNLILTGGYLNYQRHLDPILFLFSKLLMIKGNVRPIVNDPYHLYATLASGEAILGQHLITGKERSPIQSAIVDLQLSESDQSFKPVQAKLRGKVSKLIDLANLICYPPGSFYTSLIANILPKGVGKRVAANPCPKIYVPNLGNDPEQLGMSIEDSVAKLLEYLRRDTGKSTPAEKLLTYVMIDRENGEYASDISRKSLSKLGVELINAPLVSRHSFPLYDNEKLAAALLSFI